MTVALDGFALGLAYAMPIGPQNVFVIRSAAVAPLRLSLRVALVVALMDVSLAVAALLGFGAVLIALPWLRIAMTVGGVLFLVWIGIALLRTTAAEIEPGKASRRTFHWVRTGRQAFVLTWLNPQALVDGTLLLAAFRANLTSSEVPVFAVGMATASAVWFTLLTVLVGGFRARIGRSAFTWVNRLCGAVLVALAVRLALTL